MSQRQSLDAPGLNAPVIGGPLRLLRFSDVVSQTRLSKSEIYRRIRAGTFPSSLRLGARAVAWRESDIQNWIYALTADRYGTASTR